MRTLTAALVLGLPLAAAAHPLGNFTVNRYAALHLTPARVAVRYVLDLAEIPAFQALAELDADHDGAADADERRAWSARQAEAIGEGLALLVDGERLPLDARTPALELPPGAGGLPTLRLEVTYEAPLPSARGAVEFHDANFAGRPGWQEIVADGEGISLVGSTVPRTDRSTALRAYPADELTSPPAVRAARFRLADAPPGGGAVPVPAAETVGAARFRDRLTELVATTAPLGPGLVLTSLLVAAALGALHALSPGHGKTVVGAYLVGARGTARHALVLGLVVTITHTVGVYLLGGVTLVASQWIMPERLFPWLGVASGLLVLAIGASLASARLLGAAHGHGHHHHHDGHAHGDHHHEHGHTHAPLAADGFSWRSLLALGLSGGILPCPSALVVMLGAIALGRVAFGLALIVAFSAGLAAVLTAVGLLFVHAREWLERLPGSGRIARYVPVASAVVISLAGLAIVAQALAQMGLLPTLT